MREGWEMKKLGEVCDISAGGDVPKNDYSEIQTEKYNIPIYANGEKNDGLYGFTNIAKVLKPSITVSARGTIGYSVKRVEPFFPIVRLIVITPKNEELDLSYLKYGISTMDFKHSGTSIPQLTVPMIKNYEFPVPPLPEQKRIVAYLDQTFAKLNQAKANTQQNIKNARELFETELRNVFENKGEGWEEKSLKEVTTKIGSGATPRGGNENYKSVGISLIRSMNVHDEGFKGKNLAFIDELQAKELNNVTIQENDILLNITGASVARCCIVPKEILPARVNQHVSIIRIKDNLIDTAFLHFALTSNYNKKILLGIGEQGATRQAITKVQLENFRILFPKSINEQRNIISKLDNLKTQTQQLESVYQTKLNNIEELYSGILKRAFEGQLSESGFSELKDEQDLKAILKSTNLVKPDSDKKNPINPKIFKS